MNAKLFVQNAGKFAKTYDLWNNFILFAVGYALFIVAGLLSLILLYIIFPVSAELHPYVDLLVWGGFTIIFTYCLIIFKLKVLKILNDIWNFYFHYLLLAFLTILLVLIVWLSVVNPLQPENFEFVGGLIIFSVFLVRILLLSGHLFFFGG